MNLRRRTLCSLMLILPVIGVMTGLKVTDASAQTPTLDKPVGSLVELASLVGPGTTITISDRSGGNVRGRLTSIAGGSLTLSVAGRERTFAERDLKEVQTRAKDSVWEGAGLGFTIGFAAPALVCTSRSDESETVPCVVGSMLLGGLPGLFIGMGIDAVRGRDVILFRAPDDTASGGLMLGPIIVGKGLGFRLMLRY